MKRQHQTDPNLFWCPKCKEYKARGEFGSCQKDKHGLYWKCTQCKRTLKKCIICGANLPDSIGGRDYCSNCGPVKKKEKKYLCSRRWAERNIHRLDDIRQKCMNRNPRKYEGYAHRLYIEQRDDRIKKACERQSKQVNLLTDYYIKRSLIQGKHVVTPQAIELKRTAITIKRLERRMLNEFTG